MDLPQFSDSEFVDQNILNAAFGLVYSSAQQIVGLTNSPGLIHPSSLAFTPSLLTVSVSAPSPFAVAFASGSLATAHGTVDGADTSTYTVNMAPLVPASGSVTAYIVASFVQIQEAPFTVVGPPAGHPDYNPSFAAYTTYGEKRDSLSLVGTLTAPDNATTFEVCRMTLSAGQTSITSVVTSNWVYAGSILAPTGIVAGNYSGATVTVGVDGRITGISSVAYGALGSANTWTAANTFSGTVTVPNATPGDANPVPITQADGRYGLVASTNTWLSTQTYNNGAVIAGNDANGAGVRVVGGSGAGAVGGIFRNDGTNFYVLLTAPGTPLGTWTTARPLTIAATTGAVTIDGTGVGVTIGAAGSTTAILGNATVESVSTITGTLGAAALEAGDATNPGFLDIRTPAGVRAGYVGYGDGSGNLLLETEGSYTGWKTTGNFTVGGNATVPTLSVGDNSTGAATTAFLQSSVIGGPAQSWQDVTSSRAFNTVYTNSTGRPIFVSSTGFSGSAALALGYKVNGIGPSQAASVGITGAMYETVSFIVPPGSTYEVTCNYTNAFWGELR